MYIKKEVPANSEIKRHIFKDSPLDAAMSFFYKKGCHGLYLFARYYFYIFLSRVFLVNTTLQFGTLVKFIYQLLKAFPRAPRNWSTQMHATAFVK